MRALVPCLTICLLTIAAQSQTIKTFGFMLGNWELKTAKGKTSEHWVAKGDYLAGESFKHSSSDSTLTESVVLQKKNGSWYYCVTGYEKGNEGKTDFKLVSSRDGIYIFENKAHDFPKRIVYQNLGKETLFAWIEGPIDGKTRKLEFLYHSVN